DHLDMLQLLGSYIAVALDNSRKHATIQRLNEEMIEEKGELENAYKRIAHMANHDNLTQLPNRRLLADLTREYLPLARRQSSHFALLYLDLDDFKPVNDTYGHKVGDEVLVEVAYRLSASVRSSDTVGRIGVDEFVIILREVTTGGIEAIAEKVLDAICEPILIGKREFELGASIGISVFPDHGADYDALLVAADRAMYEVKQTGKRGISIATVLPPDVSPTVDPAEQEIPSSERGEIGIV
ncbi:MAG: GGDEF domain-containing protein, partial [Spirochaetales bacterium]